MNQLWTSKERVWKTKEYTEVTDPQEASVLVYKLANESDWNKVLNSTVWDLDWMRTFTNSDRNVAVSINKDWEIVEFAASKDAPREAIDNMILDAVDKWANKITLNWQLLLRDFERLWFRAIWRLWDREYDPSINKYRFNNKKFYMVHNWDPVEAIKWKLADYSPDERLSWIKRFENEDEAITHRDWFIRDNVWYELWDIKWWNWKANFGNFWKNFKTNTDIKNYVTGKVKSFKNKATRDIEDEYNRFVAETMQIYNGHIDTSDLSLLYYDRVKADEPLWKFYRGDVELKVWEEGYTIPHEYTHYNDYWFWKELVWREVKISQIVNQIKKRKRPKTISKRAELIWDLADIFKDVEEFARDKETTAKWSKWYIVEPEEIFARFWEWFVSFVKGKWAVSTRWEIYPKKAVVKYAEWLWKLDEARQNWVLFDWTLEEWYTHYRKQDIYIPDVWTLRWIEVNVAPNKWVYW